LESANSSAGGHYVDLLDDAARHRPEAPPGFTCTACGECCHTTDAGMGVTLNYTDVVRIAAHLGLSTEAFIEQHAVRDEFQVDGETYEIFLLRFGSEVCRFLDGNKCGIHAVKPWQCRFTPYRFFHDGVVDLWCMKDVQIPEDWTSKHYDEVFIKGLRKIPEQQKEA
jgi:Fe-S-cluster containining protein